MAPPVGVVSSCPFFPCCAILSLRMVPRDLHPLSAAEPPFFVGIDLGGTKIESVVLDSKLNILFRERVPTKSNNGSIHVINQIEKIYLKAVVNIKNKTHTLGIGTPGSISKNTGLLRNSTIHCQNGLPIDKLIEKKLKRSIVIENDANCFALAEANIGAGKNFPLVFGVINFSKSSIGGSANPFSIDVEIGLTVISEDVEKPL